MGVVKYTTLCYNGYMFNTHTHIIGYVVAACISFLTCPLCS